MTTTHAPQITTHGPALMPIAAVTLLGSFAFTALGTVVSAEGGEHGWGEFLTVCGFSVVAVALVFGLVARFQPSPRAGGVALGLAGFGLLTVLAFWAGVTPAFGVGGILLGMAARRTGRSTSLGTCAIAVGALAIIGYAAIYVGDLLTSL